MALFALMAITLTSCDDEPDPILAPVVTGIVAEGTSFEDGSSVTKDLNGATSAADVATNSTITITLDKAVDGSTVNVSNVSISDGSNDVSSTVTSSGSTILITPDQELVRGTQYTLTLSGIKSTDGGTLGNITRTFTTEGRAPVVAPKADQLLAYYDFNGTTDDQLDMFNPDNAIAIEFGDDRFGQGNSTATFDGDQSIIEIPNGDQFMANDDMSLSFWMKTNSDGHVDANGNPSSHFIIGLGAFFGFQIELRNSYNSFGFPVSYIAEDDSTTFTYQINVEGAGNDNTSGGWQGTTFDANLGENGILDLVKDKWAHLAFSYDATARVGAFYINGMLMRSFDFNLWDPCDEERPLSCFQATKGVNYRGNPADVEPILALGFIKSVDSPMWASEPWGDYFRPTSNHFKGDLDDLRIWGAALTQSEIEALYDAEK